MNAPAILPSPPFARWLFDRRRGNAWAAEQLECSPEYVRLMCLPFGDPRRRAPGFAMRRKVAELTNGDVGHGSWGLPARQRGVEARP